MTGITTYHQKRWELEEVSGCIFYQCESTQLAPITWDEQPTPVNGDMGHLTGTMRMGNLLLFVQLFEVGYDEQGNQCFAAPSDGIEQAFYRMTGGCVGTLTWKGREYALSINAASV